MFKYFLQKFWTRNFAEWAKSALDYLFRQAKFQPGITNLIAKIFTNQILARK